jgi:hypothetical protein
MKTLLASLLLSLLTTAACVSPERELPSAEAAAIGECDPATVTRPDLELLEIRADEALAEPEGAPDGVFDAPNQQVIAEEVVAAACECTDDRCVVDWIDEQFGCGVCATVLCEGGAIGGCVPCPIATDEPSAADGDEPCLLPPSEELAL